MVIGGVEEGNRERCKAASSCCALGETSCEGGGMGPMEYGANGPSVQFERAH